jgi:hypothetical protein
VSGFRVRIAFSWSIRCSGDTALNFVAGMVCSFEGSFTFLSVAKIQAVPRNISVVVFKIKFICFSLCEKF